MLSKRAKELNPDLVWGGYLEPLGGGLFHSYNPETKICYRASLRGALKKGRRSETSLKPFQILHMIPTIGTNNHLIIEKSPEKIEPIDLETHECKFSK